MKEEQKVELLDRFGQQIMERVRDVVIEQYVMRKREGDVLDAPGIRPLVTMAIDATIHHFLYTLSETLGLLLVIKSEDGETLDLNDFVQDRMGGLHYELYDIDGWISRFSACSTSE